MNEEDLELSIEAKEIVSERWEAIMSGEVLSNQQLIERVKQKRKEDNRNGKEM